MKRRIFVAALLVAAAFFLGRQVNRFKAEDGGHALGAQETRRGYPLEPGARVAVRGINGSVEIKAADTDTADLQVTYADGTPGEGRGLRVEHTPTELDVRGPEGGGFWGWVRGARGVRVALVLTVPRGSEVAVKGVNGPVEVGESGGPLEVSGVNGRVEVTGAAGYVKVSGVNGNVRLGVTRPDAQGTEVKGVNGNVEVRLRPDADADIETKGHNGSLTLNVPNVTMQEREGRSRMRARLGDGGAPITLKGVNGNVRFESDGAPAVHTSSLPPPPPPAPPAPPQF